MRSVLAAAVTALAIAPLAAAQDPLFTIYGPFTGGEFGFAVAGAGDVNLDGFDDVILGGPHTHGIDDGFVEVRGGPGANLLYSWEGSLWEGFGYSVAGVGDVDADNFPDVAFTAPDFFPDGPYIQHVEVHSGRTGAKILHVNTTGPSDHRVICSAAGDVNGDGKADIAVGIPLYSELWVYSGANGQMLFKKSALILDFGCAIAPLGDANADGVPDLLVGAQTEGGAGAAIVCSGLDGSSLLQVNGNATGDRFGAAVAALGDVDGDAKPDFLVGAPQSSNGGPGYARVFSGASGAVLLTLAGDQIGDRFGAAVGGSGDFEGDGGKDVIVGASQAGNGGRGYARVVSLADGAIVRHFEGTANGDQFGAAVDFAGDLNNDGFADVVIGAPHADGQQVKAGLALVMAGCPGRIAPFGHGCAGAGGFTPRLQLDGCATANGALRLGIHEGFGHSNALVFLGTQQASLPMSANCTLNVTPLAVTLALPLDDGGPGTGDFSAVIPLPPTTAPMVITLQAFTVAPGTPTGYGNSKGVKLTLQ